MKNMKKILTMMGVIALTAAIAIGGTLAYLTSQAEVKNTFTVGNVGIDMKEADVNLMGEKLNKAGGVWKDGEELADRVVANEYKLMPGHPYVKDPTITVDVGSEDCYLFVKIDNQISAIEATGNTTIAAQMAANGWKVVDEENGVYVYAEGDADKTAVSAGASKPVFSQFVIADNADLTAYEPKTETVGEKEVTTKKSISITAYAIQADGLGDLTPAQIWEKF